MGAYEEFEESRPACRRSDATSARSEACSAITASSSATWAASTLYAGRPRSGTPRLNHDHQPGASTDTPQISKERDWLRSDGVTVDDVPPCCGATAKAYWTSHAHNDCYAGAYCPAWP